MKVSEKKETGRGESKFAALYVRVSTDAQFEEGYSVDAQKEMLAAYCVSRQINHYEFFVDGGFSGSTLERPALQRMLKAAEEGKLSHVAVYKLDRLSRSQKDTMYLIEDVFLPAGVDFVSLNESFDTSTPFGRAMVGILSVFAQLERDNIRMRTRMGMKERVRNGLWMGGGRVPFGYDYDREKGVLVPNEDAERVRMIYRLYLSGYSTGRIARICGLPYERLVTQVLRRKSNTGVICYNGEEYQGRHEPIVDEETFMRAQAAMKARGRSPGENSAHLLTGLVECGVCGAKMRYQKWGKYGTKLSCYSHDRSKPHLVRDENCDNPPVWAEEVEEAVLEELFSLTIEIDETAGADRIHRPEEALRTRRDQCIRKLRRLYELYGDRGDEVLLEAVEEQRRTLAELEEQLKEEERRAKDRKEEEARRSRLRNIRELWPVMTDRERQTMIRACIRKVVVAPGVMDVYYKL